LGCKTVCRILMSSQDWPRLYSHIGYSLGANQLVNPVSTGMACPFAMSVTKARLGGYLSATMENRVDFSKFLSWVPFCSHVT